MFSSSNFLRFFSQLFGLGRSSERQMRDIRSSMLLLVQMHADPSFHRIAHRVCFAGDLEALWYLRQDVLAALSKVEGEVMARRKMQPINSMFKGALPGTLSPRAHHSITT